jgi:hypothetical protein
MYGYRLREGRPTLFLAQTGSRTIRDVKRLKKHLSDKRRCLKIEYRDRTPGHQVTSVPNSPGYKPVSLGDPLGSPAGSMFCAVGSLLKLKLAK